MIFDNDHDLRRDDEHRYFVGNREVEGVTATLKDVGLINDEWFTDGHSSRGVAIHAEMSSLARGAEPFMFLDPDLTGWVKSGQDFLTMLKAECHEIAGVEVMRWHRLYAFAGQMDLITLRENRIYIWDFKSGKALKTTRFQLAAYSMLVQPVIGEKMVKRAAVELQEDGGRAKVIEYNTPAHFHDGARFLSYLTAARDRREFGPKGGA